MYRTIIYWHIDTFRGNKLLVTLIPIYLTIECSTGFYGLPPFCMKCPYPSYGVDCQTVCLCQYENCNHVTGCFKPTSESGAVHLSFFIKIN